MRLKRYLSRMLWGVLFVIGFLGMCVLIKGRPLKSGIHVIEGTDLSLSGRATPDDFSGYREFIEKNMQRWKPVSSEEYLKQIKDAQDYLKAHPSGKTTGDLRKKIIAELNIDFLLRGLDSRALTVTMVGKRKKEGFTEGELLFKDPQVGTFSVLWLIPDEKKALHSAIISLHGHDQDSKKHETFKNNHFCEELTREGFSVMMPTFRSFAIPVEIIMNEELYSQGFTLMGLRVYETLLLIKYLKFKGYSPLGIMGHSAGSDIAYLVSILSRDLEALVYDMRPKQLDIVEGRSPSDIEEGKLHCETIPGLAYYGPQINGAAALRIPSRIFNYGYPDPNDFLKVAVFFKDNLAKK